MPIEDEMRYREKGLVVALRSALLWTALFGLAACGGGGGGGNVRPDPPPAAPPPPPPAPATPVVSTPNPAFSKHLSVTNTSAAHAAGFTGTGVRIGVVDSGVTRSHPALSPRVVANLVYLDPARNDLSVDDKVGHGTAVSQIMAGTPFGSWPGGIAPGAQIVSARIISDNPPPDDGSGSGNEVDGAVGLKPIHQDLIDRGVKVMNNSWGGLYWNNSAATAPIADEYRPFIASNGGLVVFATGNEGRANPSSMAALPSQPGPNGTFPAADLERGWLAVTAVDPDNTGQLDKSSDGTVYANACGVAMRYCLAAPGSVTVTGTNDAPTSPTYWNWKGTSLAAPLVSGAAALVWQKFPYFSNDLVRQTLLGTARDLGNPGVDATFGYGLLDVGKAMNGPAKFDWGNVTARIDSGSSTWSNTIDGAGGLIKEGAGALVLSGFNTYDGLTRVEGGTLNANFVPGGAIVASQATLSLTGARGGIDNHGRVDATRTTVQIDGTFHQFDGATLALNVGSPLRTTGAVIDGGNLQVMGVRSGYTWTARELMIVTFGGGLVGKFDALTSGPGVFLQGSLDYDSQIVWLNISRLDVNVAAQSMGLTAMSLSSAQRVEDAFDAIDTERENGGAAPVDGDFLTAAGSIQRTPSAEAAERTLSSLSGELHAADAAFAMMAIEVNRRALEARVDELQAMPIGGAWVDGLRSQRAMSHFDVDADGWVFGQDRRYGERLTIGAALARTDAYAYHDLRQDRERNRQVEGQLYASWNLGRGYLLGTLALGHMQRWTQREVLLGADAFHVRTDYSHRYANTGVQAGLPLRFAGGRITPYAGIQALQLERDGFGEQGAAGFGLSAAGSSMRATQALLGARFAHDWSAGGLLWTLQGRAEWQRLLSQSGTDIEARFTAVEVWSPILGTGLDRDVGVFGLGLSARFGRGSRIGFDFDGRREFGETYARAMAHWSVAF